MILKLVNYETYLKTIPSAHTPYVSAMYLTPPLAVVAQMRDPSHLAEEIESSILQQLFVVGTWPKMMTATFEENSGCWLFRFWAPEHSSYRDCPPPGFLRDHVLSVLNTWAPVVYAR